MEQHIFASQLVAVEPYLISHALVLEHGNRMDAEDLTQDVIYLCCNQKSM